MDWNKFKTIFENCKLDGEKIIIETKLREVINFIKNNYHYDMLKEITGIHKPDGMVELIYHLYSTTDEEDLLISISVKDETETISDIFPSAIAEENEIFDLFGVKFSGNENLKRLYMPEDWKGNPLRKDYVRDDTRLCRNDDNNAKA